MTAQHLIASDDRLRSMNNVPDTHCPACYRDYYDLMPGSLCPADDCPGHYEERGVEHPQHIGEPLRQGPVLPYVNVLQVSWPVLLDLSAEGGTS